MEESKLVQVIFAVSKNSAIVEEDIRGYLNDQEVKIDAITSPKGFKVSLDSTSAADLLLKGEDTLKEEKVNFAEDDPFCTVFVKGISEKVDETDLISALSGEGRICMVSFGRGGPNHKLIGNAFVRFNRKEDAIKAARNHATLTINDTVLECSEYVQKEQPKEVKPLVSGESASFRNFPSTYSEDDVRGILGEYGAISSLYFNPENGTGNVHYSTHGAVGKVIQALNGRKFDGHTFLISDTSEKKKSEAKYNNLYVGNVDPKISREELLEEFSKYGEIESLLRPTRKVPNSEGTTTEINKPHVFVSFKESKIASNVIKELDGRVMWGRELDINYYDPDKKRGRKPADKPAQSTQSMEDMTQSFFQALATLASQTMGNMNRGRGGYGHNQDYRGNNNYRGRGTRGVHRGRGRGGMRGGPPGGHYQQRSQYEKPMMQPNMGQMMGMPPVGPPNVGPPPVGAPPVSAPPVGVPPVGAPPVSAPPAHAPPVGAPPVGAPTHAPPPFGMEMQAQPGPSEPAQTMPPMAPPVEEKNVNGFSLSALKAMSNEDKENAIGTPLYTKLEALCGGETAGKITGMFLDLPIEEVFEIATDDETFNKYYTDAVNLIQSDPQDGEQ